MQWHEELPSSIMLKQTAIQTTSLDSSNFYRQKIYIYDDVTYRIISATTICDNKSTDARDNKTRFSYSNKDLNYIVTRRTWNGTTTKPGDVSLPSGKLYPGKNR